MKILIINPFGIGDVLFTTPLISHLRKAYPQAVIGYVANRRAHPVIESNPKVNKVYIYERDEFKNNLIPSWIKIFKDIRQEQFDIVFDFSLNASFGFFAMISGIERRIGYDFRGRGRFLTDKIPFKGYEGKHVVEYYLDLLDLLVINQAPRQAPPLEIFIDQEHQKWAKDWLKAKKIDLNKPLIAVIPGGGASWGQDAQQKRWPIDRYTFLVDKIIAKTNSVVILMGDSREQPLCNELIRNCSYTLYNAVGQTTVLQMAALLQLCSFAIVNDGGPLHIAVASGVRTISIFGPVDPLVYGPYPLDGHIVIQKGLACQPCYRQFRKAHCDHLSCLRDLSVEDVFNRLPL